jgi:phosphoglycolate phosphatase-like HAD superfamily hydrolase
MQAPAAAVVLFDIDGTLVRRAGPHHREALVEAVRRVTGMRAGLDHIPVQGMLDQAILATMLRDAGATPQLIQMWMPRLIDTAQSVYRRRCPPALHHAVCPGVRRTLARLRRSGVPMGLVTGNLRRIGWLKMQRAGLSRFFRFGAFAQMSSDRAGLVRLAIAHARRRGWVGESTRLWLVGDHENDIRAAQLNRIRALAVATGISGRADLAAHDPDLLLDDLASFQPELLLRA